MGATGAEGIRDVGVEGRCCRPTAPTSLVTNHFVWNHIHIHVNIMCIIDTTITSPHSPNPQGSISKGALAS